MATPADRDRIEAVAEAIHNIWMGWAAHAADAVDAKTRKRWQPLFVPYADLPEAEKEKDRVEAIGLLDLARREGITKSILAFGVLRKAQTLPAGQHWITVTKPGPLEGRHLLLDGDGRIQGGAVPRFFQGKALAEIHGAHLRRHWKAHAAMVHAAEAQIRKLEREIGPLAKEYARMHRESQGPSLAQRIRQVTGGHLISSHPSHVGDLTGEFRETVPAHLKRKMGGVPIDQVAESLDMSISDLLEGLRTPQAARRTIRDFTDLARHDVIHGDEYRMMQAYLDALREEAGAYQGPRSAHGRLAMQKAHALAAGQHWITIHPHGVGANASGEDVKGRPVLIDGEGRIVGGAVPKSAQGQPITSWWKQDQGHPEPPLSRHLREQGRPHQVHAAPFRIWDEARKDAAEGYRIELGHGHATETVKNPAGWSKGTHEETAPGHVAVRPRRTGGFNLESAYADRDALKAAGCRWDAHTRSWYAPDPAALHRVLADAAHFPHVTITPEAEHHYRAGLAAEPPADTAPTVRRNLFGQERALPPLGRDLPTLQGSDKQIAWAARIRKEMIENVWATVHHRVTDPSPAGASEERQRQRAMGQAALQDAWDALIAEDSAKWWIDHRDDAWFNGLLREARHRVAATESLQKSHAPVGRPPTRAGIVPTENVYAALRAHYPARVLRWVREQPWRYEARVPLNAIHMARRPGGRDPAKVRGIAEALADGRPMDPVVLVHGPEGYWIADGYHRTLAGQQAGRTHIAAYVADVAADDGPWRTAMHAAKLNKSAIVAFPVRKGYLTTGYGEGRAPHKTPDAGKQVHQQAAIDAATSEESLPTVRLNGFTPNSVWAILRQAGYRLRIENGRAMLPGHTTVRVTPEGVVTLQGAKAARYARWLDAHLAGMVDWAGQIDGKQEVTSIRAHGGHFR